MAETKEVKQAETKEVKQAETKEKMVKIRIPRERANQEDVFVSVNMRTWLIKRGETVEVPECVTEVLQHQEEMLEKIVLFEAENAK